MTDMYQHSTESRRPPTQEGYNQLQYPQLLIEASFESLLSHSHSSGSRTIIDMPTSGMSLSESWSSLSENELSHDEDLRSEATDTGSLIDVSNGEDVHSVDEDGQTSEAEDDRHAGTEERDSTDSSSISQASENEYNQRLITTSQVDAIAHDCVKLDTSVVVPKSDGFNTVQACKVFSNDEVRLASTFAREIEQSEEVEGSINMTMSQDSLKLEQRPFHILYHGPELSSPGVRSDILSKVGAALISSGDQHSYEQRMEPPWYHVVPSEFGPGSKPATADLIPIPTQMHISDCTILDSTTKPKGQSDIRLHLSTGLELVSRPYVSRRRHQTKHWRSPDLAVIVIGHRSTTEERRRAEKMQEFTRRHCVPVICLRHGMGWDGDAFLTDSYSEMLHKCLRLVPQGLSTTEDSAHRMLLDIDTFLALDSEQLNRHIHYLTQAATEYNRCLQMKQSSPLVQRISRLFRMAEDGELQRSNVQKWVVEVESLGSSQSEEPQLVASQKSSFDTTEHDRNLIWRYLLQVLTTLCVIALTLLTMFTCKSLLFPSMNVESTPYENAVAELSQSVSVSKSTSSMPTTTQASISTTQAYALSGPLQAIEKQVQHWMPMSHLKKNSRDHLSSEKQQNQKENPSETCQQIVPAQIYPSLKVDKTFFKSGHPDFEVRVERQGKRVATKLQNEADDTAAILIKRRDSYGRLDVYLESKSQKLCASINLENSISETFMLWMNSLRDQKLKTARRFGNEYSRLLEVRTSEPGLLKSAIQLQYSAARGLGAAIEAVEKAAVRNIKTCQANKDQCLGLRLNSIKKDAVLSSERAKHASLELIQRAQGHLVSSGRQVQQRTSEMGQKAIQEASKAMRIAQSTMKDISIFKMRLPRKMAGTLTEAQQRAQRIVENSRLHREG